MNILSPSVGRDKKLKKRRGQKYLRSWNTSLQFTMAPKRKRQTQQAAYGRKEELQQEEHEDEQEHEQDQEQEQQQEDVVLKRSSSYSSSDKDEVCLIATPPPATKTTATNIINIRSSSKKKVEKSHSRRLKLLILLRKLCNNLSKRYLPAYDIEIMWILIAGEAKTNSIIYCNGRSVIIRSLDNPLETFVYGEHSYPATVARFSPNGEWIVSGDT